MKKRIFVTIILIIIFTTITVILSFSNKSNDTERGSEMAIMVQNENNTNQYDKWGNETWPDESQYQLNTTKSKCNNTENVTDILSYSNNNVSINTNKTYRCNLYFDKKKDDPLTITKIDVDTSEYYTVKLTVYAEGGSGNYTYTVENTCSYCGEAQDKCGRNSSDSIISKNDNVITISNLVTFVDSNYHQSFKVTVSDGQTFAEQTINNIELTEPCNGPRDPDGTCIVVMVCPFEPEPDIQELT